MNTLLRFLLSIVFYLIFTPIGLLLRLFKIDLTHKALNSKADSYWEDNQKHVYIKHGYKK